MKIVKTPVFPKGSKAETHVSREVAQGLAGQALGFLAQDLERLERFFSLTGVDPGDVRSLVSEPGFQLAVLDHLSGDESLLLDFAASAGVAPETIGRARRALGGGEEG